ncbi:MAG: HAMP domain-containing histidine kinase [Tannerella sp.]|jgi:signal transduction histidine kinase|nr:HAMP domain-containing histidine kinase [Tannerella sp.]
MTIKRRLFFSNLRTVLISIGAFTIAGQILAFITRGTFGPPEPRGIEGIAFNNPEFRFLFPILGLGFFVLLFSVINNIFTYRMTKKITKPLEPLGEGVRQIQSNNFSHRIVYKNEDEFRPICEAFNEMATKLETSTAEKQKDEANRKELIAGISHDLRTPLTSIIVSAEAIQTGVASTPEMQEQYVSFIKNEAEHMKQMIEQLFLFSKLDMDEFPLNLIRVDITLAISEMLEDSQAKYEADGLSINLSEMPKGIFVSADVFLFRNVIVNIIKNSIKYKTKTQGQMEISATVIGNHISFRFTDDGPGVETNVLPKLLDVFYRADPSRTEKGSGLGLAISAKIVERMGGTIDAELPPSGGLAIIITLPVLQDEVK